MTTKLTLTIEKRTIDKAKNYAKNSGRSLSDIIEEYLEFILMFQKSDARDLSPRVKKLMGSVPLPKNYDYKKELRKAIFRKHNK